uniref:Histone H1 putative n=1 Tax=Albugo laibachii Nc14 TaxID=890382 RepID=F0WL07_9STRA|nr:histone H1 putative [Albugo laibachii Nc14]|eukprot:CCA21966.1 histone H1 putative [Albugo laibachii Nc14]
MTSAKKAISGPGYYDLIKEAVHMINEKSGLSRQAIDKYVSTKKGDNYSRSRLNLALKKGVENGKLVPVKGSFKLATGEKKTHPKTVTVKVKPSEVLKTSKKQKLVAKKPSLVKVIKVKSVAKKRTSKKPSKK